MLKSDPDMKRKAGKVEDNDGSKKRGRPRVEKNDESAADKRRMQIRNAQRAYRQRKESTLEELRVKVTELSKLMDTMQTLFEDSVERLAASGVSEQVLSELRTTMSHVHALKSSASTQSAEQSEEFESPVPEDAAGPATLVPKNTSIWLDKTELSRPLRRPTGGEYVGLGYSYVLPESVEEQAHRPFRPQATDPISHLQLPSRFGGESSKPQGRSMSTQSRQQPPLRPPLRVYSFQESTFARRIHRACLEAGYSLLLDPARNPPLFEKVFKLPLLGRTREELIECMKAVLERGPGQPLELYESPLVHIGGAGTHYPRQSPQGHVVQSRPAYNLGLVGPSTMKLLMQADEQRLTSNLTAEIEGYEGEWFDPYDVEGYLRDKGVYVDPLSSFAEVENVDISQVPSASTSNATASPKTPGQVGDPLSWKSITPTELNDEIGWEESQLLGIGELGYTNDEGKWVDIAASVRPTSTNGTRPPARKTVMIDVAKLVRGLLQSAVCLGQTPGFRRQAVDRALAAAYFDVFS